MTNRTQQASLSNRNRHSQVLFLLTLSPLYPTLIYSQCFHSIVAIRAARVRDIVSCPRIERVRSNF